VRSIIAALLVVPALPLTAPAQSERIDAAVERYAPEIIELRHRIHQHPELGNREFETAELIAAHLEKLGFDRIETGVAHTGVVGILRGGEPGGVVAVRADMDALPVTEDTPYPFKSTVRTTYLGQEVGVAHACGHDIHTAVQLGVAAVLAALREQIPGTVKFIFQPAEEGPPPGEAGGAPLMVDEGVLENPEPTAIFGLHSTPGLEVGDVGYVIGPTLASSDQFRIVIHGKQSHGASPHLSIDPVVMASQAVMAFQTIRSRTLPPLEPSVISVGIIRGGERFNIIPAEVRLEGTVRTYNEDVRDQIERRLNEILAGITQASGGTYELEYERGAPPTINDPDLAVQMVPTLTRLLGDAHVHSLDPIMAAEDFAYFARIVPGFYFSLGTTKPGTTSGWNHTPDFMADDTSVPVGMRVMSNLLLDYLKARAGEEADGGR
jgi:amidohydrolase